MVKLGKMGKAVKVMRWIGYDRDFTPNRHNKTFKRWADMLFDRDRQGQTKETCRGRIHETLWRMRSSHTRMEFGWKNVTRFFRTPVLL